MKNKNVMRISTCLTMLALAPLAQAIDVGGIELDGSGFMTLAVGKIIGGRKDTDDSNGYKGPRFISDWGQGGVYENDGLQFKPDSRLGLQGTAKFSPQISATGQIVGRGARNGKVDLEWLFGTYKVNDELSVQVGRKRLPIFSLSETQDVGFAYPWVHLPPDTYGWQVVNYDGINIMYSSRLADWTYVANIFAGNETNKDAGYQKMYNGKYTKTNVRWKNIIGGELTATHDWFESRIGYFQNDAENGIFNTSDYTDKYKQKIYTLGFVVDYNDLIARADFYFGDLSSVEEKDYAQSYSVGYRIGRWTPMFTYSNFYLRYREGGTNGWVKDDEERHDTRSWSLRYDLTTSSALKLQYDDYRDRSGANFRASNAVAAGNARLITMSYDLVF